MNVLIDVPPITKSGGSTRHLEGFLTTLDNRPSKNSYVLVTDKCVGNVTSLCEFRNLRVIFTDKLSRYQHVRYLLVGYKAIIREFKIDLIISLINLGFPFARIPQINFQRNALFFDNVLSIDDNSLDKMRLFIDRCLYLRVIKRSEVIITPTATMKNMITSYLKNPKEIVVIPHPVSLQGMLNPQALPHTISQYLDNSHTKLLYVSHLMPHKNHFVLLDALKILGSDNVSLYLTVDKTDWPEGYEMLLEKISNYGLQKNVVLLPRLEASILPNLYNICDVFLFPSLTESFGFPVMEAMACGMPLVVADTPVNRELCGDAALYHHPYRASDLALHLANLLKELSLLSELRNKSRQRFLEVNISWDEYIEKLETLMNELLMPRVKGVAN